MAAYAAVVSLMNNIDQMMIHPRLSISFDNSHILPLREKADSLLEFIEDCFSHGGGSKEAVEDLERRIASAAHAAEDVIESHIVDQIHVGTSEVSPRCSLELQQIIHGIDDIIEKATEEREGWRKLEKSTHTAVPLMESGKTSMVGFDQEFSNLLNEVTWDQSSRRIISIVGMGGTGKTTLATNIYEHAYVKQHFDIRAWTTISQQYKAEGILSNLLSSIGVKFTSGTADALGEKLHKALCGRRYLIVLDDIWSVKAWDKVRRFFPVQNGSRVLLTTRLSNVATHSGSSYCLKMDLLDGDKSWKLFCDKASFPQKYDPPQLEDVGKEIVKSCKGLALSIVVIGGLLLKSPRTVEYWKGVARDIKSFRGSEAKQEILDVLSLSYNHLPPHLKPCFLYMGVFDEDSDIRISNLIKLWIGEGFLKPNGSRELEDVAEGYINDLIDRNLILVGRRSCRGKIKTCGFHDLLRDLSIKIAVEQKFFHVHLNKMQGSCRRLITHGSLNPTELPLVRSIICSRSDPLLKHRLLRVFDKASYSKEYSMENFNLRHLTLTLHRGYPYEIPSSFSLVWNLQSLIINLWTITFSYFELSNVKVVVMPDEFWKMRQLRHVKCEERIYLPNPCKDEKLMLLLTLKRVVNLRLSEEVCNIISNTKKLHLSYHSSCHGYDESLCKFVCNTDRLHKLESLKMEFEFCKLLVYEFRFPISLKKLCLSYARLCWKIMSEIGSLPNLEVLKLENFYVAGGDECWMPVNDQFLRLKFLKIKHWRLCDWVADSCHFPSLEKLVLIGLDGLREIPSGIGDIGTLELIHVEGCSEDAAVSAIRIKEYRVEDDADDGLQVQVAVHDFKLKSLMERLKREELTIENFQFKDPGSVKF